MFKKTALWSGVPRHLALLGGTTTFSDFVAALRCLAHPLQLASNAGTSEYENVFARTVGVRYGCSFSSGRVGFYGLLRALGVGEGDEVLVQAPTHIVIANAVHYAGAGPVYVDCRLDDYNMDLEQAEMKITPRTRVLLLQHTFGIPANIDAALDLVRRHRLILLEDCVHALGARYCGRPVGSFGKAAFFSTEETKTISSTMGGMVVTDDAALADAMKLFQSRCPPTPGPLAARYVLKFALYYFLTAPRVHRYARAIYNAIGQRHPLPRPTVEEELAGLRPQRYEMRLSNAQAVLACRQLRRLESNLAHRGRIAKVYSECLTVHKASLASPPAGADPAYVRFPVWVADRNAALKTTAPHAVLGTWFTSVLEEAVTPESGSYVLGSCPRAELAAKHLVNLPTHPRVRPEDAAALAAVLLQHACEKGRS